MSEINEEKTITLKELTKSNVWDMQENDIISIWQSADHDAIIDSLRHYIDITRVAFELEELKVDNPKLIEKFKARGLQIAEMPFGDFTKKWGIKKRPIVRVTDLTYENIRHVSAIKLLEVIDRNFGGGWESLSQTIRDIIESGFDISTTTLPKDRLHNPGGMYEKMTSEGYEVLEINKGSWVEAIFAKVKPLTKKHSLIFDDTEIDDEDLDDEDIDLPEDNYNSPDEDDDELSDDELTEESYRTTIDETPDLDITVDDLDDEEY